MELQPNLADAPGQSRLSSGIIKVPITIEPHPEGGYAVRSPVLPELITEGSTIEDAAAHVADAVAAVLELYEDLGKSLPSGMIQDEGLISYDALISMR